MDYSLAWRYQSRYHHRQPITSVDLFPPLHPLPALHLSGVQIDGQNLTGVIQAHQLSIAHFIGTFPITDIAAERIHIRSLEMAIGS